jgi:tRNA threonylcarbamoyladenosine modification (KEOPS) complex Cgi121 subunit
MEGRSLRILSDWLKSEGIRESIQLYDVDWKDGILGQREIEDILSNTREFILQHDLVIQFFSRNAIAGPAQVLSAVYHALRAGARGTSRTRDLSVDVLRFAAGERQIKVAVQKVGIQPGIKECLCLVFIPDHQNRDQIVVRSTVKSFLQEIGFGIVQGTEIKTADIADALEATAMMELKL